MKKSKSKNRKVGGLSKVGNVIKEEDNHKRDSLVVIGTGIRAVGQLTMEAVAWMRAADMLFYVAGDPVGESIIKSLNPKAAKSLSSCYKEGKPRIFAYNAMVERILRSVRSGKKTVAAFYGHPGVFAYPSHESIRIARMEGFSAHMLPGVSSEDCLFADLGVDPGEGGCQSYEATEFLFHASVIDPCSQLVLWQIGIVGDWTYKRRKYDTRAMPLLIRKLARYYPLSHRVTVYQAAMLPGIEPIAVQLPLYSLPEFPLTAGMTLYVPPARPKSQDREMMRLFKKMIK